MSAKQGLITNYLHSTKRPLDHKQEFLNEEDLKPKNKKTNFSPMRTRSRSKLLINNVSMKSTTKTNRSENKNCNKVDISSDISKLLFSPISNSEKTKCDKDKARSAAETPELKKRKTSEKPKTSDNSSKTETKSVAKGKKKLIEKTESFEKYGIVLPSHDKIIQNKKQLEDEKKALDLFEELFSDEVDTNLSCSALDTSKHGDKTILDCKHISNIEKYFTSNLQYITDILRGKEKSERHELFHSGQGPKALQVLTCSPSIMVFNEEQRDELLRLMELELDTQNSLTDYFIKVLLPELCLKIFMDVHRMEKDEAIQYLDWRPIE